MPKLKNIPCSECLKEFGHDPVMTTTGTCQDHLDRMYKQIKDLNFEYNGIKHKVVGRDYKRCCWIKIEGSDYLYHIKDVYKQLVSAGKIEALWPL